MVVDYDPVHAIDELSNLQASLLRNFVGRAETRKSIDDVQISHSDCLNLGERRWWDDWQTGDSYRREGQSSR